MTRAVDVNELKGCIKQAEECLGFMLEDALSNQSDAAQAFMESAEEAQRQIMRAVTLVFVASQPSWTPNKTTLAAMQEMREGKGTPTSIEELTAIAKAEATHGA